MTRRSFRLCLSFVEMCLWAMLTTRGIQGYRQERQPFWNALYNNRIRPMKTASNVAQFPRTILAYSIRIDSRACRSSIKCSGSLPVRFLSLASEEQRADRFNSGKIANGFAGMINLPLVPMIVFPMMPQQATTQREQETSPQNEEAALIEKNEESSVDRGVSSTTECPVVFQETTQIQQVEEDSREKSPTKAVQLDRESVPSVCQGNREDARKNNISILIKAVLQNGELLRSDEWIKWQSTTKRYGTQKSEQHGRQEQEKT